MHNWEVGQKPHLLTSFNYLNESQQAREARSRRYTHVHTYIYIPPSRSLPDRRGPQIRRLYSVLWPVIFARKISGRVISIIKTVGESGRRRYTWKRAPNGKMAADKRVHADR